MFIFSANFLLCIFKFLCLILFVFLSCSNKKKTLNFEDFQINVPKNWKIIELKGIDSKVGGLHIGDNDTVTYDLGLYSDNLEEYIEFEVHGDSVYVFDGYNDSPILKISAETTGLNKNHFFKNEIEWDVIDGKSVKIVRPKKSGIGLTGAYIDSLGQTEFGKISFRISGLNLSPKKEEEFLKAIKTISFNQ